MPQSGFMTIFCLIGLLTTVYFVGGFLDWATEYVPIYIIVGCRARLLRHSQDQRVQ